MTVYGIIIFIKKNLIVFETMVLKYSNFLMLHSQGTLGVELFLLLRQLLILQCNLFVELDVQGKSFLSLYK